MMEKKVIYVILKLFSILNSIFIDKFGIHGLPGFSNENFPRVLSCNLVINCNEIQVFQSKNLRNSMKIHLFNDDCIDFAKTLPFSSLLAHFQSPSLAEPSFMFRHFAIFLLNYIRWISLVWILNINSNLKNNFQNQINF